MRVEVEGRVYPGVSEHLLDHLGVFAAGEHERREAVAQRVERDVRQTRTPEQRLERAPEDVVAVEGRADRRGKNEACLLPAACVLLESLFYLALAVIAQGLHSLRRQPHAAALVVLGGGEGGSALGSREYTPDLKCPLV